MIVGLLVGVVGRSAAAQTCAVRRMDLKFSGRTGNLRRLVLGFGGVLRLATRVLEPRKSERRQVDRRRNPGGVVERERRTGGDRRVRDRRVTG
ncbi:MAG: hypothetical protein E6G10_03925 [Actinobacteria bacterium]|nr:MAG: hypothetical protein E6G10_03925 [Actinomycetota bacterium]